MPNYYHVLDLFWQNNILAKPHTKMMTVPRFPRQNDIGLRALNVALWENVVVVLVLGSKGPYYYEDATLKSLCSPIFTHFLLFKNIKTKTLCSPQKIANTHRLLHVKSLIHIVFIHEFIIPYREQASLLASLQTREVIWYHFTVVKWYSISYHFTGIIFSHSFITLISAHNM